MKCRLLVAFSVVLWFSSSGIPHAAPADPDRRVLSPAKELRAHILLPTGKGCRKTLVNGQEQTFARSRVGGSQYVDFVVKPKGKADMEILFQAL